ncbi:hypothetical protein A2U01_0103124, partial [Trifolium medium]|nr:hypothetical protein [Trifolium medium]
MPPFVVCCQWQWLKIGNYIKW